MPNDSFQVTGILFEFEEHMVMVTVTLKYHSHGMLLMRSRAFQNTMSAAEILRSHMDDINEWPASGPAKIQR